MNTHSKKKAYQRDMKRAAKEGKINDVEGKMVPISALKETSMTNDYIGGHKLGQSGRPRSRK